MEATLFGETILQRSTPPLPRSPAPQPPQCPELDLSITLTPERPAASVLSKQHTHTRSRQVHFDVSAEPQRARSTQQHPVTMVTPQTYNNQLGTERGYSKRKQDSCKDGSHGILPLDNSAQKDEQLEEGAELNTTLALKVELQQLKEAKFDSQKAVQEKLQSSTVTQEHIRARAAEGLNFPRSQQLYRALVNVNLSHDQILNEVLRDRPALAPPPVSHKVRPRPVEGPELLTFYNPQQLYRETPLLPGDQVPLARPKPQPRPTYSTFHLHQRRRQWEV